MKKPPSPAPKLAPVIRTSAGLRDALFDELDRVINGKSSPGQANAVSRLADGIVSTVQLEIEISKLAARAKRGPQSISLGSERK